MGVMVAFWFVVPPPTGGMVAAGEGLADEELAA
jgi:hypothetical protein